MVTRNLRILAATLVLPAVLGSATVSTHAADTNRAKSPPAICSMLVTPADLTDPADYTAQRYTYSNNECYMTVKARRLDATSPEGYEITTIVSQFTTAGNALRDFDMYGGPGAEKRWSPGPIGDRAVGVTLLEKRADVVNYGLVFLQGPYIGQIGVSGIPGKVSTQVIIHLARVVDGRLKASLTAPRTAPVKVRDCGAPAVLKPTTFVLDCAGGMAQLNAIHWTSWGAQTAVGTATYKFTQCTPNCTAPTNISTDYYPNAMVQLSAPEARPQGMLFTKITIHYLSHGTSKTIAAPIALLW